MPSSIDLIQTDSSFYQVLDALCSSTDILGLENKLADIDQWVDRTAMGWWIKKQLSNNEPVEETSPITRFILLVTYSWVYSFENTELKPKEKLHLLAVLAKYIWPLYELFVRPDSDRQPRNIRNEDVRTWLTEPMNYQMVTQTLDVKIPNDVIGYATLEVTKKNSSTISRWIDEGLSELHAGLCTLLNVDPIKSNSEKNETPVPSTAPKAHSSSPQEVQSAWQPPTDQIELRKLLIVSPLGDYLSSIQLLPSFDALWQQKKSIPTINQVAKFHVQDRLRAAELNDDQKILAQEFLFHFPAWSMAGTRSSHPIARIQLEARWKSLSSENISPLIDQMLKQGLLKTIDHQVSIADHLIFDYYLTRSKFKWQPNDLYPPSEEISPAHWLDWLLMEFHEREELEIAGTALWNFQGTLPGYLSGSWDQIVGILAVLPPTLLQEPTIWVLAKIAINNLIHRISVSGYSTDLLAHLESILPIQPERDLERSKELIKEYNSGLDQFQAHGISEDEIVQMAISGNLSQTREKWSINRHVISSLRYVSPDYGLVRRFFSKEINKQTLGEYMLRRFSKTDSWEEALALAELFAQWKIKDFQKYIQSLQTDHQADLRLWILRNAVKGSRGFVEWV